jgi:Fructose-1-6-bisphosphatase, C-terminal domain
MWLPGVGTWFCLSVVCTWSCIECRQRDGHCHVAGMTREARVALGRVGPVGCGVSSGFCLSVLMHASLCGQAGGKGSTGVQRVLDVDPDKVHQRVPLFIGSRKEVDYVESFLNA